MSDEEAGAEGGEPEPELLIELVEAGVSRLELRPGDRIVITTDEELSRCRWAMLKAKVEAFFHGHPVMILDQGARMGIISAGVAEPEM